MTAGDVLVVTGPPAAGKSTLARLLAARRDPSVHLHADDFWHFITTGYVDPWLPAAHDQNEVVMRAVCDSAADFAAGGYRVVLDAVLGPWFLPALTARCPPDRIRLDYMILLPPLEGVLANLTGRSGHGFTSVEAATHMYRDFAEAVTGELRRHVVDPSGQSPDQTVDEVERALAAGVLRVTEVA